MRLLLDSDVGYLHHLDLVLHCTVLYCTALYSTVQWPGWRISPSPGSRYNYLYLELWSRLDQRLPATNIRHPTWRSRILLFTVFGENVAEIFFVLAEMGNVFCFSKWTMKNLPVIS